MALGRTLDGEQKTRIKAMKGKQAIDRKELENSGPVRVRGKVLLNEGKVVGYYGVRRIREGQVFVIKSMADFSDRWMERVDKTGRVLDENGKPKADADVETLQTDEEEDKGANQDQDVI